MPHTKNTFRLSALLLCYLLAVTAWAQPALPDPLQLSAEEAKTLGVKEVMLTQNNEFAELAQYNPLGQLTERITPQKSVYRLRYTYDKRGRQRLIEQFLRDSTLFGYTKLTHKRGYTREVLYRLANDKKHKGQVVHRLANNDWILRQHFDETGTMKDAEAQRFDARGRKVMWEKRNANNEWRTRFTYAYNDSAHTAHASLEQIVFPSDPPKEYGPFLWRTFDDAGRVTAEFENGQQTFAWQYNKAGQLVKSIQWHGKKVDRTRKFEYNNLGQLVKDASYDADGRTIFVTTLSYNSNGLLIGSETRYPRAGRVVKKVWEITYF